MRATHSACRAPCRHDSGGRCRRRSARAYGAGLRAPGLSHCDGSGIVWAMTHPAPLAPRSNGWSNRHRAARRAARHVIVPTLAVLGLTAAGYLPGVLAVAVIAHVTGAP